MEQETKVSTCFCLHPYDCLSDQLPICLINCLSVYIPFVLWHLSCSVMVACTRWHDVSVSDGRF